MGNTERPLNPRVIEVANDDKVHLPLSERIAADSVPPYLGKAALVLLEEIKDKKSKPRELRDIVFLTSSGLVDVKTTEDYAADLKISDALESLSDKQKGLREEQKSLDVRLRVLRNQDTSWLHYLRNFHFLNRVARVNEQRVLASAENRSTKIGDEIKVVGRQIDDARAAQVANERFTAAGNGNIYVRLNEQGEQLLRWLSARSDVLANIDVLEFKKGVDLLVGTLKRTVAKASELGVHISKRMYVNDHSALTLVAAHMAAEKRTVSEVVERMTPTYAWLREAKVPVDQCVLLSAQLVARAGSVSTIEKEVRSAAELLIAELRLPGFKTPGVTVTFHAAVALMQVPGDSLTEKFARLSDVAQCLNSDKWRTAKVSDFLRALDLAKKRGSPSALADSYNEMVKELTTYGYTSKDGIEAAAMRLVLVPGAIREKCDRVVRASKLLQTYGLDTNKDVTLSMAAGVALMPGLMEGNVHALLEVTKLLQGVGFGKNRLDCALAVYGMGLKDMMTNSGESESSTNPGSLQVRATRGTLSAENQSSHSSVISSTLAHNDQSLLWMLLGYHYLTMVASSSSHSNDQPLPVQAGQPPEEAQLPNPLGGQEIALAGEAHDQGLFGLFTDSALATFNSDVGSPSFNGLGGESVLTASFDFSEMGAGGTFTDYGASSIIFGSNDVSIGQQSYDVGGASQSTAYDGGGNNGGVGYDGGGGF